MKERTYNTNQVCARTGAHWYSVCKYAKKGLLPTAKLIMREKKGRWEYTEKDIEFLSRLRFYRVQGYEFWISYDKAKKDLTENG
jgi:DNA-binding transcriptional MerR regulator